MGSLVPVHKNWRSAWYIRTFCVCVQTPQDVGGVYGLLSDSSVLCDIKVWTLLSFLMSFSDLRPQVWFSSQSKEQVSRQCMRKKTLLFGYPLDLESQSAMKPYHMSSSEQMHLAWLWFISPLTLLVDHVNTV